MLKARDRILCKLLICAFGVIFGSTAYAADADNGKTLANRWCSSCHVVQRDQKLATDQAPPLHRLQRCPILTHLFCSSRIQTCRPYRSVGLKLRILPSTSPR